MNSSGHKASKRLLVLLTGVCLAANGLYAAESSTANSAHKPVSHPSAHSTSPPAGHPAAKKAGSPSTASHYATNWKAVPHRGSAHYGARKTTPHASSAPAMKRTPSHANAHAPQRKGSPARGGQPRTLTGQQRLARLHLQPERVQEIQQALTREGYLQGDASGQWDSRTREAMLRYQTMNGFPTTGLPDAKSLMKLGLGSHPLPAELDHGAVGVASPGAAQGDLSVTPPAPPVSQAAPPS
ncbi:MAG: peptidoglycan-binding protein [Terriglobia bacterium]